MDNPRPTYIITDSEKDFSQILTNPFLDIAARFWEKPRYDAFRVCYRSMRLIDDLVDDRKIEGSPIGPEEVGRYRATIYDWLDKLERSDRSDRLLGDLGETLDRFAIPIWLWQRLGLAMIYDLEHDGFASFRVFLRYAEGAAIAPASVFMHLCGVEESIPGKFTPPRFDIRRAARPLALYSYLVHIVRDFQKDQLSGLNYFAEEYLSEFGLHRADLRRAAEEGDISDKLRDLIRQYRQLADFYRLRARRTLDHYLPYLSPQYQLSLEVIYGLYSLVFDRIDPDEGRFTSEELNPTPPEVEQRLQEIIARHKI